MMPLIEKRLAELKEDGVAPVEAIKTIHVEFGLSLAAAKQVFATSIPWAQEALSGALLQEQILDELDKNREQ
jgi:hypothetical protein